MGFRADRDDRQEPTENQTDCDDSNSFEHFSTLSLGIIIP